MVFYDECELCDIWAAETEGKQKLNLPTVILRNGRLVISQNSLLSVVYCSFNKSL